MLNLINGELYKLRKSKSFLICEILMVAMILFVYFAMFHLLNFSPELAADADLTSLMPNGIMEFTETLLTGDIMPLFISIMMCLLVTVEFRLGTVKNMAAVNRRPGLYLAKLFTGFVMSFVLMGTILAMLLLVSVLIGDVGSFFANLPFFGSFLLMETLLCCAMSAIYVMLSFILQNVGAAMPVCILSHLILQLVLQVLAFVYKGFATIATYMPDMLVRSFITPEAFTPDRIITAIAVSVFTIVVTTLIGMTVFRNADI